MICLGLIGKGIIGIARKIEIGQLLKKEIYGDIDDRYG